MYNNKWGAECSRGHSLLVFLCTKLCAVCDFDSLEIPVFDNQVNSGWHHTWKRREDSEIQKSNLTLLDVVFNVKAW
jgi:hypothetical protein